MQSNNKYASPQYSSVFSDPSPNMSRPALPYCQVDQLFGQTGLPVLGHIKYSEILANYLFFIIPLYFFAPAFHDKMVRSISSKIIA